MSDDQTPAPYTPSGGASPADPYGQADPSGQSQPSYGQPPGQYPQYGAVPPYQAPDPDRRPGTVTAGAVIALVMSGLSVLGYGLSLIGLAVARDDVLSELRSDPDLQDFAADDFYSVLVGIVVVLLIWSIVGVVLAIMALRRSNLGRILLVVSSGLTAVLSFLSGFLLVVPFVVFAAAVATIVLLFVGGAGDWYARRGGPATQPPLPPGTTQPWG